MNKHIDVVILGGGYAGVMAANRLMKHDDVRVTVVNPRAVFVPRLRLHQLVGGTHDATCEFEEVLADDVRLVVDTATRINAAEATVTLTDTGTGTGTGTIGYDYLVYAVGSGNAGPQVPGAAEFAYPMATWESSRRLRSALHETPTAAAVTVVGGGPTGVEVAAELAEQGRTVTMICGRVVAPHLHATSRRTARKYLTGLGVTIVEGADATVTAVHRDSVELRDGRTVPSRITVWAAGFGVPDLATRSGLRTDSAGRLVTDETLTSVDDARIVAAGDSATPSDLPFRMGAYIAGCLGAHAADTLLDRIAGRRPSPINLGFPAICSSFGRNAGIFQITRKDDTPTKLYFPGFMGTKLKEASCQASVKHLVTEAAKPGSHHWPKDDKRRPALLRANRNATM